MTTQCHSVTVTFVDLISPTTGAPIKLKRTLSSCSGKTAAIKAITSLAKHLYREAFGGEYEGAIRIDHEVLK